MAATYRGWPIFGCHPGDCIVSIFLRINDTLMLCKFPGLLLIAVFAGAHLVSLPHFAINTTNIFTSVPETTSAELSGGRFFLDYI